MAGKQGLHLKGVKLGGRKKGVPNKVTASVKDAFTAAYKSIGGDKALADWARANPTHFYQLYAKLIPQDINKTVEHRVPTQITFNAVDMSGGRQVEYVNKEDVIDVE
jgi:hypothetical protein